MRVVFASACSNDYDSLYAQPDSAVGTGSMNRGKAPDVGPPKKLEPMPNLPAKPDADRIDDCERCAETTCAQQRSDCLEDDDCSDELGCKGVCSDPACLQTCSAHFGWSPWYADYANCVFGECRNECNTGHNWQCARAYDWPAAAQSADRFDVEFHFTTPPTYFLGVQFDMGVAGHTVLACEDDRECGSGLDSGLVNLGGIVTLTLSASSLPPKDFRGYLEVEESTTLVYGAPLARAQVYYSGFLTTYPPMRNASAARLGVAVIDCLAAPVPGASVTLPDLPEVAASAFNTRRTFSPGPTTAAGIAALVDLPDSAADAPLLVHAEGDDGLLIEERAVWVRPGWTTFVYLLPSARSD